MAVEATTAINCHDAYAACHWTDGGAPSLGIAEQAWRNGHGFGSRGVRPKVGQFVEQVLGGIGVDLPLGQHVEDLASVFLHVVIPSLGRQTMRRRNRPPAGPRR